MLINKNTLAKAQGIKVFDVALPQQWIDKISNNDSNIYSMLLKYCVWSYDENKIFGCPIGLNSECKNFLNSIKE
jgi:hypothetical protein